MKSRYIPNEKIIQQQLAKATKQTTEGLKDVMREITGVLVRHAGLQSAVPQERWLDVRREAGTIASRFFVGRGDPLQAIDSAGNAHSPFAQIINVNYAQIVALEVAAHTIWLRRNVPQDVFNFLASSRARRPFGEADEKPYARQPGETREEYIKRLDDLRIFAPDPGAEIDPNRQWVPVDQWTDSRGYQLSDRIWNTDKASRDKIDKVLVDGLRNGDSPLSIAEHLVELLNPGRDIIRTSRPYGTNVAYDAMRLVRTELARAANQAAYISAYLNPYVNELDYARSNTGDPKCPVCPQHATIGIGGGRIRPPYNINAAPIPPAHPHCKCHIRPLVTDNPEITTERIRAVLLDEQARIFPAANAASPSSLISFLLQNPEMMQIANQTLSSVL